jgi:hypothetical protein
MLRDPGLGLDGKSVVVSPTSIAIALAMARAGARGATATEMDAVLRSAGWDELGSGLSSLQRRLAARDAAWIDEEGEAHGLALRMANMAFAQDGWPIEQAYLDAIAAAFGNGLGLVDYRTDPEGARRAINGWVARQTVNRIPELLGAEDLTRDTKLALVNAIYLKAEWQREFDGPTRAGRSRSRTDRSCGCPRCPWRAAGRPLRAWPGLAGNGAGLPGRRRVDAARDDPDPARQRRTLRARAVEREAGDDRVPARRPAEAPGCRPHGRSMPDCDVETYPYSVNLFMPRFGIDTRADLVPVLRALAPRRPTATRPTSPGSPRTSAACTSRR